MYEDSCAWLQTTMDNKESGHTVSAINCYFMCQVHPLTPPLPLPNSPPTPPDSAWLLVCS